MQSVKEARTRGGLKRLLAAFGEALVG